MGGVAKQGRVMTSDGTDGIARREVLRRGALMCAGALGAAVMPQAALAAMPSLRSIKPGTDVGPAKATVLRWLSSSGLNEFNGLCPGWSPASAAAVAQTCPTRLSDLVDGAPVHNFTGPQQVELRLIGFDGVSPAADLGLDVLFPADGLNSLLPYRLGQVSSNRLLGSTQTQRAWSWDGRVPLSISSGRARDQSAQLVDLPAEKGVYLIALADPSRWIDPAALAFVPIQGLLHRRLLDLYGNPMSELGYFVVSVNYPKV
jgi:hypothetical protein